MILDIAGLLLILLFFIRGYMRGLIVAVFSVLAVLLGILCALKLSGAFASWLLQHGYVSSGWVQVVSYVILFLAVVIVVRLLARLIQKSLEGMMLGTANKFIGGLLYAFLGAVVWSSFLWIGKHMNMIPDSTIAASRTYAWLAKLAPWIGEQAGKILPFVKDTFAGLEHFFDTINRKQGNVGAH